MFAILDDIRSEIRSEPWGLKKLLLHRMEHLQLVDSWIGNPSILPTINQMLSYFIL